MKLTKKRKIWLTIVVALVPAVVGGHWWYERGLVTFLFDIERVPWSVSSVDCASEGLTDTLVTCAFTIDPADFDKLLQGENYAPQVPPYYKRSHELMDRGADFTVSHHYLAKPKDSPHGGSLDVLTDNDRKTVLAHLYIE